MPDWPDVHLGVSSIGVIYGVPAPPPKETRMNLIPVHKFIRAAAIAAVVGAAGLSAMPTQAAPYFSFGFGVGPSPNPYYGDYDRHYRPNYPTRACMGDREVRRDLQRSGYDGVRVYGESGPIVRARGVRHGWLYVIQYDRCRGYITSVRRISRT
jgi:hypothetical protein